MQRTGRFQVGQQGRNEVSERHTKVLAGGTAHLLLQVSPTRFDALGVVVAHVAGRATLKALGGSKVQEVEVGAVVLGGAHTHSLSHIECNYDQQRAWKKITDEITAIGEAETPRTEKIQL